MNTNGYASYGHNMSQGGGETTFRESRVCENYKPPRRVLHENHPHLLHTQHSALTTYIHEEGHDALKHVEDPHRLCFILVQADERRSGRPAGGEFQIFTPQAGPSADGGNFAPTAYTPISQHLRDPNWCKISSIHRCLLPTR